MAAQVKRQLKIAAVSFSFAFVATVLICAFAASCGG